MSDMVILTLSLAPRNDEAEINLAFLLGLHAHKVQKKVTGALQVLRHGLLRNGQIIFVSTWSRTVDTG